MADHKPAPKHDAKAKPAHKDTKPEPHPPTVQPGPAQGADPAVVIDRPEARAQKKDAAAIVQLQEDNGAGPRQEPVRRQVEEQGDGEHTKPVKAGEKGAPEHIVAMEGGIAHEAAHNAAVKHPEPKKHGKTEDHEVDALADQLIHAMEKQDVRVGADSFGRTYEFYTTTMNNQSVVMAVVKRGGQAQQMPVSTATLHGDEGRENAKNAIRALDGMLV